VLLSFLDRLRHFRRRAQSTPEHALGRRGEDLAHRFLRRRGYTIVARNYRLAAGDAEADLIAHDAGDLVIVEVKTRTTGDFGPPERAIGPEKQRALARVAREYARKSRSVSPAVRCDVVTVVLEPSPHLELFRDTVRWNCKNFGYPKTVDDL
jgi:putative endonuclease